MILSMCQQEKGPFLRVSTVDSIIAHIQKSIEDGTLVAGSQISPEHEICAKLNVSRSSVREAIKALEALGVLEIRRGEGTFITAANSCFITKPLMFKMLINKITFKEMLLFRVEVELSVMRMSATNAKPEDIAAMKKNLARQQALLKVPGCGTLEDRHELDWEFHQILCTATHNALLQEIYNFVLQFFTPMLKNHYQLGHRWESVTTIHKRTLKAIINNDTSEAVQVAQTYFDQWYVVSPEEEGQDGAEQPQM